MKKSRLIPALLAAVLIATVAIFNACSKQESTLNPVNEQELSPRDLAINNTIKNFRNKVGYLRENPGYKSSESYTADSALWLLEATINYSHTFPNEYYGQLITDTLNLTLATNDAGEVDMNELALKYDAMKASISQVYHSKAIEDKGLVLVNLEDISFKSDGVEIEVVAVTGEIIDGTPPVIGNEGPFKEGDDWWYGETKGHCPEYTFDSDAAEQLSVAINNYISDPDEHKFYTYITRSVTLQGGEDFLRRTNDPLDNQYDYYLFSASDDVYPFSDETLCLSWIEMNVYFNYLCHLAYEKIPESDLVPSYLTIILVDNFIDDWEWIIEQSETKHYFHQAAFHYGLKVSYDEGEEPSEI
jgi:hypothetical protein